MNSVGTEAGPGHGLGRGRLAPGRAAPLRTWRMLRPPGEGGGRTAAGRFVTEICRFTTHRLKKFSITHLTVAFGILANPQIQVIRVMAHKPGCIFLHKVKVLSFRSKTNGVECLSLIEIFRPDSSALARKFCNVLLYIFILIKRERRRKAAGVVDHGVGFRWVCEKWNQHGE